MGEYSWANSDEYDNLSNKLFLDSFYTGVIFLSNDIFRNTFTRLFIRNRSTIFLDIS